MNKLNFRISKWIIGLFVLALLLIIGSSTNWFRSWGIDYNLFIHELGYGILIGLIPSVLIGYISFKEQFEKQLQILGISKEIINAGVSNYNENWDISILEEKLKGANEVEFYMTYGSTVINNLSRTIKSKLQEDGFSITIYIMDEKNPFVNSLGSFWEKDNKKYNPEGIRSKIEDTLEEINTLKVNLKKDEALKGKIRTYKLRYHPVFFSFYRFDDEIVFVPSKNVERKSYQVPSFVCNKTSSGGLFNWCNDQIQYIKGIENDQALIKAF
jgi:hypothetical protein